jgi:tetratricopeptide (TPR) repeat protein
MKDISKTQNLSLLILLIPALLWLKSYPANAGVSEIDVYLANLNGQIEGFTYKVSQLPDSVLTLTQLSQLWYEKSGYTGNPYDTERGIALATKALSLISPATADPETIANLYLMRARQQMRLHKFPQVQADLDKARSLGAPLNMIQDLQIDLDWNQGHNENALKQARRALTKTYSKLTLIRLAGLEHELGNFQKANQHYQAATSLTDDGVSLNPVQRAWLQVQIGLNYFKMSKTALSEKAFRDALTIAPDFPMALEHLAESLALVNRTAEAIALYEKVLERSTDPEFIGQLAKLYRAENRLKEADRLALLAKGRFLQLLKDFPEAMYWHAASFFSEEGNDPMLALNLLEKNAQLRPNSASYLALARAQSNLNQQSKAKDSIIKVLNLLPNSREICDLAIQLVRRSHPLLKAKCRQTRPVQTY